MRHLLESRFRGGFRAGLPRTSFADIDEDGAGDLLFTGDSGIAASLSVLGTSSDCDENLVPDECEPTCNESGVLADCDVVTSGDCNRNRVPDACEVLPRLFFRHVADLQLTLRPDRVCVLDLDGDGMRDVLAITDGSPALLAVLVNREAFAFEPLEPLWVQRGMSTYILADLDLDGDRDIAAGSSQVRIVRNDGFRFWVSQVVEIGLIEIGRSERKGVVSLRSGDLDGDDDPDLALLMPDRSRADPPSAVLVLRNQGRKARFRVDHPVPVGCCAKGQTLLDADDDGDLDLLVEGTGDCFDDCPPRWTLLRNRGDASFENVTVEGDLEELFRVASITLDPASVSTAFVPGIPDQEEADIDGDGLVDRLDPSSGKVLFGRSRGAPLERTVAFLEPGSVPAALGDLDGDGDPDLAAGSADGSAILRLFRNDTLPALSQDRNLDGVPDECDPRIPFHRGDPDGDGRITLADGISSLRSLFLGGARSRCRESEDFNNDGRVDLTDPVALFRFLFLGGPPPEFPGPPGAPCGRDTDPPGSARDLGCEVYEGC